MPERFITYVQCEDPALEEPGATRERLRDCFPRGATRRMTQLGMLVGRTLADVAAGPEDTVIYASGYGETRALEQYLESFPSASPTLFQTSIHPSAVQQGLIGRQLPIRTFLPMTGSAHLFGQALAAAVLDPAPRVILVVGEERGTWLLERHAASERAFAFALLLERDATDPIGSILHHANRSAAPVPLTDAFEAIRDRRSFSVAALHGGSWDLTWK